MSEFLDRISKLSPQRLALLADELNQRVLAAEKNRRPPIAIVGIGCRFPGGVQEPEGFWKLLREGTDAVREVPRSRWNVDDFYDPNPDTPGKMTTRWGGFVDNPDLFDPQFFGIAPGEAIHMDPQQRLLLETSWEALEHAGIPPSGLMGTKTGVFVGICNSDYSQFAFSAPREKITPYVASGLSHAVAAGRISYVLGLQGPNLAVDTSCSASLVAVHLACQSLRLGESDAALAGGVNLIFNPDITIALSQSRMMSSDGHCKAFSNLANGFVRGEGCGVIVLKRLPDALRDRNRILAVIRGSACNQDGRSSGLTAPNGPSQEVVLKAALNDAGLRPSDVDYVEAHGTGTALGDPIELEALHAVFKNRVQNSEPLFVGSVKTNLGHLESAAGIAGLMKLVLSIQHGEIPPSLHFEEPNHRVDWDRLALEVPNRLRAWKRRGDKRTGGVSSFGFSGTNAHVVVEEYVEQMPAPAQISSDRPLLFLLSAKTESALWTMEMRLRDHLISNPTLSLADVAYTLNRGRSHFDCRAGIVAGSRGELIESLSRFSESRAAASTQTGHVATRSPRLAMIFDDGSWCRSNMARDLYETSPVFREAIQRCERALGNDLGVSLTALLYPERAFASAADVEAGILPARSRNAAAFALQYALTGLWSSCGIKPAVVGGWGVGEYVAACIAEIFPLEDALRMATADSSESSCGNIGNALSVQPNPPKLIFVAHNSRSSRASAGTAEYWRSRPRSAKLSEAALGALEREACTAVLTMGSEAALRDGKALRERLVPSLDGSLVACPQFLKAAAALYVLGCELDLGNLYNDASAKLVSLPTYPFERERYWLESDDASLSLRDGKRDADRETPNIGELRTARADFIESNSPTTIEDEWIYDLVWEEKPLVARKSSPSNVEPEDALLNRLAVTSTTVALQRIASLAAAMAAVAGSIIFQAFQEAGLSQLPTAEFTLEDLCERLKFAPNRRRIVERLLAILVEDRIVERNDERFRFIDFRPQPDFDHELQKLSIDYPEGVTEIEVLRRCAKKLSAVLRGIYDPMQLVFTDGSIGETERIYEQSPVCRFFNEKAAQVVRAAVERIPDRSARILEIGGGTGATTGPILSALTGKDVDYIFTDISPVFLSRARNKFSACPSMQYQILNIEKNPIDQGFEAGGYDIVIAANVLHTTADLRQTIAHIRKLLTPGGLLLLIEGVRPDRWLDLTLGLTDGWWHFADRDLRPKHPLISAETWATVLREAGLGSTRTISYVLEDGSSSQQIAIVSRADVQDVSIEKSSLHSDRNWVLLTDDLGVGEALQSLLIASGESCQVIRKSASTGEFAAAFDALLAQSEASNIEIVYLWGLNVADAIDSTETLLKATKLSSNSLVAVIQKILARGDRAMRLTIATRGAQATPYFSPSASGAAQSLVWGVGRTLGLEYPKHFRALIDLDPSMLPESAAATLFSELIAKDKEDQIALHAGKRLVARLTKADFGKESAGTPDGLRGDGSYLIVGGLGGIGLRVAQWAAQQGPGHLVLLGRTGLGANAGRFAERSEAIRRMEMLGVPITVIEADVASKAELTSLFRRFGPELPPLRGVFHAATVGSSAGLTELTDRKMDEMLRAKVLGTWTLHELTKNLKLDFFLAFSSTASILGARDMAHYVAANQFIDAFSHHRRAIGLPMLSVNWGAWDVMRLASQQEQAFLEEIGILPMQSDSVLGLFKKLITSSRAQIVVANIDWNVLKPVFELHRTRPLLEKFSRTRSKRKNSAVPSEIQLAKLEMSIAMTPKQRRKFIEEFVLEHAAYVLGFHRGELPPTDVPLTDLGLDSLMAVDLKNRLQAGLGQELSSTIIFDYPMISNMVGLLETMLLTTHDSAEPNFLSADKEEIRI